MGIHTGPKDGDYARYVEFLTSGTSGEPGRVYPSKRAAPGGWSVESEVPPLPGDFPDVPLNHTRYGSPYGPANGATTASRNPISPVPLTDAEARRTDASEQMTLAARGAKRLMSLGLSLIATCVAIGGVLTILHGATSGDDNADAFIPGLFMMFFALMLFKAAQGMRRDANRAGKTLPPLTTLSSRTAREK